MSDVIVYAYIYMRTSISEVGFLEMMMDGSVTQREPIFRPGCRPSSVEKAGDRVSDHSSNLEVEDIKAERKKERERILE